MMVAGFYVIMFKMCFIIVCGVDLNVVSFAVNASSNLDKHECHPKKVIYIFHKINIYFLLFVLNPKGHCVVKTSN